MGASLAGLPAGLGWIGYHAADRSRVIYARETCHAPPDLGARLILNLQLIVEVDPKREVGLPQPPPNECDTSP